MSLLPALPNARLAGYALAGLSLVATGAALVWWGLSPRIEVAQLEAKQLSENLDAAKLVIEEKASQLQAAAQQAEHNNKVDIAVAQMRSDIAKYGREQTRAIEELRKHDELVDSYLRGAVPAALGRLYERAETTDPRAYGSPDIVQPDPVRAAGPAGAGAK